MDHRTNRLSAQDARDWDIAYERFCETGEWKDEIMEKLEEDNEDET
jgi:hypothetical protein